MEYLNLMNIKIIKKLIAGIYGIKCSANNKIYIGSSINIRQRLINHKCYLKNKKHYNQHLQNSFNLYGEDSFFFVILEEVSNIDLLSRKESYYISLYNSTDRRRGFNMINESAQRSHSLETKEKMSQTRKGRTVPLETRKKMQAAWTEERRSQMSLIHQGREVSSKTRLKLSNAKKGIKKSTEERSKLKASWTNERKKLLSQKMTGKKRTKESIEKLKFFVSRPVLKISLNNEVLERFESIKIAASKHGTASSIRNSCKDGKPRFGFKWMYASSKLL